MAVWEQFYAYGLSAPADSTLGHAIVAVKRELAYNGFEHGLVLTSPTFGDAARAQTSDFQAAHDLKADGVVGPATALALFERRARAAQTTNGIPGDYLCKIKSQESSNDPAAVGDLDPDDHGLMEINLRQHSSITVAQAIDPAFCIPWAGHQLASHYLTLKDWPATIASYNVGLGGAEAWFAAGKPALGGTAKDATLYQRATLYVWRVLHSPC